MILTADLIALQVEKNLCLAKYLRIITYCCNAHQDGSRDKFNSIGQRGGLLSKEADIILVAGFVNAVATVKYIKKLPDTKVTLMPMAHEGTTPSLEDDLCSQI